ncbi:MaoC family dehydratase [Roseisolibacter sp. H3M3-2]|uniref:MaoC family dehydratase n=1 Tax=Roseisolibacter sp. H3M3-2 TaxID=3031323 RepID=UPI0023DBCD8B|nr:MaoC family dehydratase [Roseisolibacter sp. H3M3-2]MDF1506303.1 MaoC family dehydratase [Roseisolibacter sp. H3M3-2]
MPVTRLASPAALAQHLGREVAVGDWLEVTPERVRLFADATDDHQWIHLDPARATAESPYGGPVAHGLLTLSLVVPMVQRAVAIDGVRMIVNYGFDRVRFPAAVPVGSRVRARVAVVAAEPARDGGTQVSWRVTIEREGGDRPAVAADWIARLYA